MNNKFIYCLECGAFFEYATFPVWGTVHQIDVPVMNDRGEVEGADKELCYFPVGFTFSALPEIDPEWDKGLIEPGKDELTGDDFNSLELGQALSYFGQELVEV